MNVTVVIADSVTKLPPETDGGVVVGGSHGAVYAAYLSVKARARAAIHHDAGIGLDEAGVSGLAWAETHGMAMAAVATDSAHIGVAGDMLARGVISRANTIAASCGVRPGQSVAAAVELLKSAPWPPRQPAPLAEGRHLIGKVVCLDSLSMADGRDAGRVLATGSHGGVPAGETALGVKPALALFNDAGFGADRAGVAGLSILDRADIASATVAALSARIGDGRSTLTDGVLSEVNQAAYRLGARVGSPALALARAVAEKASS
jgi:hypothetical protein